MASITRFDVEKLTEKSGFLYVEGKVAGTTSTTRFGSGFARDAYYSNDVDVGSKKLIMGKAHNTLIISLEDKALREVVKETTAKMSGRNWNHYTI